MSTDGQTVIGWSSVFTPFSRTMATRWTATDGLGSLGTLPNATSSIALACSADGRTVVGFSLGGTQARAFRYLAGQLVDLGVPGVPNPSFTTPQSISWDGQIVGGFTYSGATKRGWRLLGFTYTLVGPLPGGTFSDVKGVSGDGSVLVGEADQAGITRGFTWSVSTGLVSLELPSGATSASARACNINGSVIVGISRIGGNDTATVWRAGVPTLLTALNSADRITRANSVSADGGIIAGESGGTNAGETRACVWDRNATPRKLEDLLLARSLNLDGWTLTSANSITPDGQYFAGIGTHRLPDGITRQETWVGQPVTLCPGDWNGDGFIDIVDVSQFVNDWMNNQADVNLDGGVDGADLEAYIRQFSEQRCQ
jgi:uncharacterized membrane protein